MHGEVMPRPAPGTTRTAAARLALWLAGSCVACSDGYVGLERGESVPIDAGVPEAALPDPGEPSVAFPRVVRGAVYFPARAYNVDQTWQEYDASVIERDLGYAAVLKLNALRIYGSYHAYRTDAALYESHIDHLLETASAQGMRVQFVLYEGSGGEVDDTLRALKDPLRAVAVQSVPTAAAEDEAQWQPFGAYVSWFMDRFRSDPRLLAIEVVNDSGRGVRPFARAMLDVARQQRGTIALAMGAPSDSLTEYASDGVGVLQLRNAFPADVTALQAAIEGAQAQAQAVGLPLWISEWQRIRPSGPNWSGEVALPAAERYPDLAPMALQIKRYEPALGSFFWSLMVKPGFVEGQRNAGTVNGMFWEDGAVWDLAAARILADDPTLMLPERKRAPFEVLHLHNDVTASRLACNRAVDGTGQGQNIAGAVAATSGDETTWRLIRIDNEAYFRLESAHCEQWLQCSAQADATQGSPDPVADADTLAVRAVDRTNTGDQTRWRLVPTTDGDWQFFLQNKATGYYLEVSALPDADEGASGARQVRAVPSTKTGPSTRFRSSDASH
jgi:hypothetical protein